MGSKADVLASARKRIIESQDTYHGSRQVRQRWPDRTLTMIGFFRAENRAAADQIGNAVPATMAAAVGLSIHAALKDIEFNWETLLWPELRRDRVVPPLVDAA